MKISELLRKLADLVDQTEEPSERTVALEPVAVDNTDNTDSATMVSPLQQTHELLKKSTGVENHVEEFADDDEEELASMKRLAGIGGEQDPVDYGDDIRSSVSLNPKANAALEANGKEHLKHTQRKDF